MMDDPRTITIEVTAERARTAGATTVDPAVANTAAGVLPWIKAELAWLVAMFLRVTFSVALYRSVARLLHGDQTRKRLYERADVYWKGGKVEADPLRPSGGGYSTPGGTRPNPGEFSRPQSPGGPQQPGGEARDKVLVGRSGPYMLWEHGSTLARGQFWPCPLLYRSPCQDCHFHVSDRSGKPHCAALVKVKMIKLGQDQGEDLEEVAAWIEQSG